MLEFLQGHPAVSQSETRVARPAQPAVEPGKPAERISLRDAASPSPDEAKGERRDNPPPSTPPLRGSSSLTTYRDHDSGRLVVRVVDERSGDILIEFPPERPRSAFSPQPKGERSGAGSSIEV